MCVKNYIVGMNTCELYGWYLKKKEEICVNGKWLGSQMETKNSNWR